MIQALPLLRVDGVAHAAWCAYCHNDTFLTQHGIGKVFAFCPPGGRSRFERSDGPPVEDEVRCLKCNCMSAPLADLS